MSRFLFPVDMVPPIAVLDCELAVQRLRAVIERPVMREIPATQIRRAPTRQPQIIEIGGGVEAVEEDAERWDGMS